VEVVPFYEQTTRGGRAAQEVRKLEARPHRATRSFSMKLSLVVLTPGKTEGKILSIPLAQFVIGRDPQCHLRPASLSITTRHCALIQRDGKAFVRDFDSTNGTFVNDKPV